MHISHIAIWSTHLEELKNFYITYFNGTSHLIKAFIPVSTNCYWFISCYILLMIFSPYINRAIDSMSELQYRQLLLLMSAVFLVAPTVIYYSVLGGARML